MKKILILSFVVLLSSCSTTETVKNNDDVKLIAQPVAPSSPPPVPKPVSEVASSSMYNEAITGSAASTSSPLMSTMKPNGQHWKSTKVRVALREFIYRSQPLKGTDYNLVVLNNKPMNQKQLEKVIYICELWKNTVPDKETYLAVMDKNDPIEIIPFYWPLKKKITSESCVELVENYDYERVQILTQTLKIKQDSPQFLYRTQQAIVTMDISKIDIKEDIEFSMETWRENMCLQFDKNVKLNPKSLVSSVKKVLGILSGFITVKT